MKPGLRIRWCLGILAACWAVAATALPLQGGAPAPVDPPDEAEMQDAAPPRGPDADKAAEAAARERERQRLRRIEAARLAAEQAASAASSPQPAAVAERLFETVRVPVAALRGEGDADAIAQRAEANARRRADSAEAEAPPPVVLQRHAAGDDDPLVNAFRTVREVLRQPLTWLLVVLVVGGVLTLSWIGRRAG